MNARWKRALGSSAGHAHKKHNMASPSPVTDGKSVFAMTGAGKLAAFLRTLRDASFAVGLREGQDAATLLTAGYGEKPGLLRSAFKHLFSARKADWEKFDGIFDAFWLGRRVRSRVATAGTPANANNPATKSIAQDAAQQGGVKP